MTTTRTPLYVTLLTVLVTYAANRVSGPVYADDPPVRSQAVVNLTFDEASGISLDSATSGTTKDNGALQNGAMRLKSPFWGQSSGQALALDAAARQFVQIADSPELDRPDAVTFSMFFVNLHPPSDAAYHGIV